MRTSRVVVRGHVQGVFFRATTRDLAREHDVAGWVRNDPEGTVTMHLEGDEEGVDTIVSWARSGGPSDARVQDVDVIDAESESCDGFTIEH